MRRRNMIRIVGMLAVLSLAVVAVAEGDSNARAAAEPAAAADPATMADTSQARATFGNCYWKAAPVAGGRTKVKVPSFCKNGMCRINLLWAGDFIGALGQGFGWGADYAQWDGGWWAAGPAVNIAGWSNPADGLGRNGDGVSHLLFAGQTADGSTISLVDDDPGFENSKGKFVLELDHTNPGAPQITWLEFWACRMG